MMGTRSLTYVYNEPSEMPVVCMYRQFDGYPSGHGAELADFLSEFTIVNGLDDSSKKSIIANGMGCLAAQIIANFKTEPGNIYLQAPILNQNCSQDYEYHIFEGRIVVKDPTNVIFDGDYDEFVNFCAGDDE